MKKIIVISAIWCPSCLLLKKNLSKISKEYNIKFTTYDYDLDEDKIKKYGNFNILPVIIVDNKKLTGEKNYNEIINFLKECDII